VLDDTRLAWLSFMARAGPGIADVLEEGDIFFFYRPRVEVEKVKGREDVQRLYMIMTTRRPRPGPFRVIVIGRKKLPEIIPGRAHPEERNWATVVQVSRDPARVRRRLGAQHYVTLTRGERTVGAAKPVGEGRYELVRHGDHTELAYVLELPERPSLAQDEFEIKKEASYIISVRNPDLPQPPGVPAPRAQPDYPPHLREKFASHRWIPVDDVELLNFPNTQVLLIGAHADSVQEELGIRIDEERETMNSAEVFRRLRLNKDIPLEPLFKGTFPSHELPSPGAAFVCPYDGEAFEQKSRYERHLASAHPQHAPTAADVQKALAGVDYPKSHDDLVAYAAARLPADSPVHDLIRSLPDRTYQDAADVSVGLGEITRRPPSRRS
jgi:hypothetical protein